MKKFAIWIILLAFLIPAWAGCQRSQASSYPHRFYTTGYPKHRSPAAKREFLRLYGLTRIPKGYQIDHIIPLAEGGADDPANMQLLTIEQHRQKTKREMKKYKWNLRRYPMRKYEIKGGK